MPVATIDTSAYRTPGANPGVASSSGCGPTDDLAEVTCAGRATPTQDTSEDRRVADEVFGPGPHSLRKIIATPRILVRRDDSEAGRWRDRCPRRRSTEANVQRRPSNGWIGLLPRSVASTARHAFIEIGHLRELFEDPSLGDRDQLRLRRCPGERSRFDETASKDQRASVRSTPSGAGTASSGQVLLRLEIFCFSAGE